MPGVLFPDLFRNAAPAGGAAIAGMAPDGRFIAATADTDLVWLEDRSQAKAAIRDMLG